MALTFFELKDSRPTEKGVDGQTFALKWIAFWSTDYTAVRASLEALAGVAGDGLPLARVSADSLGNGVWLCAAEYDFRAPQNVQLAGDPQTLGAPVSIELTAGQVHITQSKETVYSAGLGAGGTGYWQADTAYVANDKVTANGNIYQAAAPGTSSSGGTGPSGTGTGIVDGATGLTWNFVSSTVGAAPDYKRAIGVTRDRVQGCDVFAPKFEFSVTNKHSGVDWTQVKRWRDLVATTNDAAFKTFDVGEVLYLGGSGRALPGGYFVMSHRFAVGKNLTQTEVSPDFKVDKKAWEYVWATYGPQRLANQVLQLPTNVYVERVYDTGDFDLLGLTLGEAGFTFAPATGVAPVAVAFTDASSGTPIAWQWDFGDATPQSTDQNPVHTFNAAGTYTVTLTVTYASGTTSTITHTITIT